MELEKSFAKQLRALNGTSREDRFPVLEKAERAAKFIVESRTISDWDSVRDAMSDACLKFGRAIVGICLAATILLAEPGQLSRRSTEWAYAVMDTWTNHGGNAFRSIAIRTRLHPTKVDLYARSFINCTSI